ncbi:MAG: radical SAM protein, partial [Candidatus Sumerlaeota bacterium]|nr:radical SAM protein [Candidatus Sumerlaeota bacterium]
GGDPLVQSEFLLELLAACQRHEIRTAVDTTGYAPCEVVQAVAEKTDLFLYDLKLMDAAAHEKYTGVSNQLILDNLKWLASSCHKRIIIRFPVVPGYTDGADNITAMADFLKPLGAIREIHLLPYHKAAAYKYERLGEKNKMAGVEPPSSEALRAIQAILERRGFQTQIGG